MVVDEYPVEGGKIVVVEYQTEDGTTIRETWFYPLVEEPDVWIHIDSTGQITTYEKDLPPERAAEKCAYDKKILGDTHWGDPTLVYKETLADDSEPSPAPEHQPPTPGDIGDTGAIDPDTGTPTAYSNTEVSYTAKCTVGAGVNTVTIPAGTVRAPSVQDANAIALQLAKQQAERGLVCKPAFVQSSTIGFARMAEVQLYISMPEPAKLWLRVEHDSISPAVQVELYDWLRFYRVTRGLYCLRGVPPAAGLLVLRPYIRDMRGNVLEGDSHALTVLSWRLVGGTDAGCTYIPVWGPASPNDMNDIMEVSHSAAGSFALVPGPGIQYMQVLNGVIFYDIDPGSEGIVASSGNVIRLSSPDAAGSVVMRFQFCDRWPDRSRIQTARGRIRITTEQLPQLVGHTWLMEHCYHFKSPRLNAPITHVVNHGIPAVIEAIAPTRRPAVGLDTVIQVAPEKITGYTVLADPRIGFIYIGGFFGPFITYAGKNESGDPVFYVGGK